MIASTRNPTGAASNPVRDQGAIMTKRTATTAAIILTLSAAGAPAASAFPGPGPGAAGVSSRYALPSNFHTDASSGGYVSTPVPTSRSVGYALPSNFQTDASSGGYASPQVLEPSVHLTSPGFQWGDAGIGAAGASLLLCLGALGAGVARRRTSKRSVLG
jgi:hypothetical protein